MVCFVATTAGATTFIPLSDRQLVEHADAIVVGTVRGVSTHTASNGYVMTDYDVSVADVLKGFVGRDIVVREWGGAAAGRFTFIEDSATYTPGERVFAFLRRSSDGTWFTASMAVGKFTYSHDDAGAETLVRNVSERPEERSRDAVAFKAYVRDVVGGHEPDAAYFASPTVSAAFKPTIFTTASQYCIFATDQSSVTLPIRIPNGESGAGLQFHPHGTQANVPTSATLMANGAAAWTGDTSAGVVLTMGTADTTHPFGADGVSVIYLDSSDSAPSSLCDSTFACAIGGCAGSCGDHTFHGETFHSINECDILMRPTLSTSQFAALITHEMGHAIGLRHSNQGTPSSSSAIMTSTVNVAFGSALQQWDKDAVDTVYGSGPPCVPPAISSQSQSQGVNSGSSANLTVAASGTTPYTYQWYNGQKGDTSSPISGETNASYHTPAITVQKSFWVRVSNDCGSVNSETITLTPIQCAAPTIVTQPQGSSINSGSTANLTVTPGGGGPFTYQWFIGPKGDQTNQAPNGTSQNFTTPALTQATSFWVKVSNACGSVQSDAATININGVCLLPSISNFPSGISLGIGESPDVTLTINGATSMQWYQGQPGDTTHPLAGATTPTLPPDVALNVGLNTFWIQLMNACGSSNSGAINISVSCVLARPTISVPPTVQSGKGYTIAWTGGVSFISQYELQESTSAAFDANVQTFTVIAAANRVMSGHPVTSDTRYYYRVRAIPSCGGDATEYSDAGGVLVIAPPPPNFSSFATGLPYGSTDSFNVNFNVNGAFNKSGKTGIKSSESFTVSFDVPWLSASPSSGTIGADGAPVPVTITINPSQLPFGSSQATMSVSHTDTSAATPTIQSTTSSSIPLSVSLVSAVTPTPKDATPPAGTLIIPAVAHADGVGAQFVSDARVTNTTTQAIQYQLTFTGIATDGTQSGKQMKVNIAGGGTLSLNDIVKSWFGAGAAGEGGIGSIEVRPLNAPSSSSGHSTVGASRTYASTASGTFGQFIPALPTSNFLGKSDSALISLQQVAQSTAFRTNFGLVEGSGSPAQVQLTLFNGQGQQLAQNTFNLSPYELQQFSFGTAFPTVTGSVPDGRVEAKVLGDTGKISAYASVLDNATNDPLLVLPVDPSKVSANTYVIPGVGDFDNASAHWKSDVRIYNASSSDQPVTLTYYPQGGTSHELAMTIPHNQVLQLDNFIATKLPSVLQSAGSLVVTSSNDSSLVATARTYTDTGNGTYGQFIPGVSPSDGIGVGDPMLQVLQLEQSPSFHTNAGVAEVSGNPVSVILHLIPPDGRTEGIVAMDLQPYEFRQLNSIFGSYGTVYNGRIAVEVVGGTGRVTGYASNIDNQTKDPTYIPAQQ
jgi:hypothetical protein